MLDSRQRIQNALFRTIKNYELLIAAPESTKENWGSYGDYQTCSLCRAVGVKTKSGAHNCFKCPLAKGNTETPCFNDSFQLLHDSLIQGVQREALIRHAMIRLNWILRTAKKNGWKVHNV